MSARLLRSEDFERLLKTRSRSQTAHFALHHLGRRPTRPPRRGPVASGGRADELSTGTAASSVAVVDDSRSLPSGAVATADEKAPDRIWLGAIVPKRHARRSVTRSLLKRQIRAAVDRHEVELARGLWIVRLRSPFDRSVFTSAASDALKIAARTELDALLRRVSGGR